MLCTFVFMRPLSFRSFSWKWLRVVSFASLCMYSILVRLVRGAWSGSCIMWFLFPPYVKARAMPDPLSMSHTHTHAYLVQTPGQNEVPQIPNPVYKFVNWDRLLSKVGRTVILMTRWWSERIFIPIAPMASRRSASCTIANSKEHWSWFKEPPNSSLNPGHSHNIQRKWQSHQSWTRSDAIGCDRMW